MKALLRIPGQVKIVLVGERDIPGRARAISKGPVRADALVVTIDPDGKVVLDSQLLDKGGGGGGGEQNLAGDRLGEKGCDASLQMRGFLIGQYTEGVFAGIHV